MAIRMSKWAGGKLLHAQVCTIERDARTLARNINERKADEEARVFERNVRGGWAGVVVWMLVIREVRH